MPRRIVCARLGQKNGAAMQVLGLLRVALLWLVLGAPAMGQEMSALARLDPAQSSIRDAGQGISLDLGLSQPVPYRVFVLDDPPRLVLDAREIDYGGADPAALDLSDRVDALRVGRFREGWSRLVAELDGPYRIVTAVEETAPARIRVVLAPTSTADFAARAAAAPDPAWGLPQPVDLPPAKRRQRGEGPLIVALDPGHGGLDPGAEAAGLTEADLMLTFGRELAEILRRAGMQVVMTREEDVFVPLAQRIRIAREAEADVFLSLHADALASGVAVGATIYRLNLDSPDAQARQLAERHDRDDLLAGIDLGGADDLIASVLIELARAETQPRADRLAEALVAAMDEGGIRLHAKPIQAAAFSVLKAPDMPSLLLELGFLSSRRDRQRLTDAEWRGRMQEAIRIALEAWARADAVEAARVRR